MSDTEQVPPGDAQRATTRRTWLIRLGLAVLVIVAAYALWYLLIGRNSVDTDDAYVGAEMAQITPLSSATVIAVEVSNTQFVRKGTVLAMLDPADAQVTEGSAEADLALAQRRFHQSQATGAALTAQIGARAADIASAQAHVGSASADVDKARADLSRREALVGIGGVSGEEVTTARKNAIEAQAALAAARAMLAQAEAARSAARGTANAADALVSGLTEASDPGVRAAQARLTSARLEVGRMVIRAPIDGVVSGRQVQVGQRVAAGTPIMAIVPQSQMFVDANFKESQLRGVRVGMKAEVTTDLYGSGVVFHGKVSGIAAATGAATALIPAQNATGNWIKVVQRVPVRITLDPQELAKHPLGIGLSCDASIDLTGG